MPKLNTLQTSSLRVRRCGNSVYITSKETGAEISVGHDLQGLIIFVSDSAPPCRMVVSTIDDGFHPCILVEPKK